MSTVSLAPGPQAHRDATILPIRLSVRRLLFSSLCLGVSVVPVCFSTASAQSADGDAVAIEKERSRLEQRLAKVDAPASLQPDARIFLKGIQWALRYEKKLEPKDAALIQNALARAQQRVEALAAGKPGWTTRKGRLVRGFVSA